MNLLAHAVLSPDSERVRVGNVVADFIPRNQVEHLDPDLKRGVELHQRIDRFTDSHPIVQRSHNRLTGFKRFANPLVDVFYDHFLTLHWRKEIPLNTYVDRLNQDIEQSYPGLPEECVAVSRRMIEQGWMRQYGEFEGLEKNLGRMERRIEWRTNRTVDLVGALQILKHDYTGFERDFLEFWPQLVDQTKGS